MSFTWSLGPKEPHTIDALESGRCHKLETTKDCQHAGESIETQRHYGINATISKNQVQPNIFSRKTTTFSVATECIRCLALKPDSSDQNGSKSSRFGALEKCATFRNMKCICFLHITPRAVQSGWSKKSATTTSQVSLYQVAFWMKSTRVERCAAHLELTGIRKAREIILYVHGVIKLLLMGRGAGKRKCWLVNLDLEFGADISRFCSPHEYFKA